jgi:antitoxin component of MazEF toxin-antitoxin module
MPQLTIVSHGDSAALILSAAVLESAGLHVGDVVDVTLGDRQLILRTTDDGARRDLIGQITRDVLDERQDAYRRLA